MRSIRLSSKPLMTSTDAASPAVTIAGVVISNRVGLLERSGGAASDTTSRAS